MRTLPTVKEVLEAFDKEHAVILTVFEAIDLLRKQQAEIDAFRAVDIPFESKLMLDMALDAMGTPNESKVFHYKGEPIVKIDSAECVITSKVVVKGRLVDGTQITLEW
jgi:hypothetical protein